MISPASRYMMSADVGLWWTLLNSVRKICGLLPRLHNWTS